LATNQQKVAVIGASSMVGSRFCELQNDFKLIKADLDGKISVDITNNNSVKTFFQQHQFSTVILFSAYTDVDEAEKQRGDKHGIVWEINVKGTKNVVDACRHSKRKLLLISTDFVFDGQNGPYPETEAFNQDEKKISWYGLTKKISEDEATTIDDYIILRITYPYRSKFKYKKDFVRSILEKYEQNNLYPLFFDQLTTPTFIDDLAPAIQTLLKTDNKGIYHLASLKSCSPYVFAKQLLKKFGKNPKKLTNASLAEILKRENSTPRPLIGGLKVEKLPKLGFMPTSWENGIEIILAQKKGELI